MFRTVGIGLLSLLTVAVVAVALGGWQVQRNLASRTEELSGQLASLTATQQAMLAQQRPPEITGLCYLGDRSKPAADVEIEVFRFFDGGRTNGLAGIFSRRIRTDGKGRFATNGLKEGDYCLLAPLVSGNGSVDSKELIFTKLQSRPVNLLTGGGAQVIDLDLLPNAKLDLNFDPSLPDFVTVGELDIPLVVSINVYPNGIDNFPMSLSYESPNVQWPLPGQVGGPVGNALLFPSDLPNIWELPSWNYVLGVYLTFGKPGAHGAFDPTKTEPKNTLFEDMATISKRAEDSWARIITRATSDKLEITSGEQIKVRMQLLGEPLQDRVASVIEALDNRVIQTKGLTPQQLASQVVRFLAPNVKLEVQIEHIKSAAP